MPKIMISACLHRRRKESVVGGHHGECGARAYDGGLAESILVIGCPTEPANLAPVRENSMFCYGPLVSELGGLRRLCLFVTVITLIYALMASQCSGKDIFLN